MLKKIHILLDCSAVFSHGCVVVIGVAVLPDWVCSSNNKKTEKIRKHEIFCIKFSTAALFRNFLWSACIG
jgi:hypothetical protein